MRASRARFPPQPDRHVHRLYRLAHDGLQVGAQRLELDLLAQAGAERLERALRVVLAPVEATIDQRCTRERSGRNRAATTSVETAIARFEPPANDENNA